MMKPIPGKGGVTPSPVRQSSQGQFASLYSQFVKHEPVISTSDHLVIKAQVLTSFTRVAPLVI